MAHRLLNDPEADGWERSDFPIVCETCLGPNPYVRMQRIEYGGECHISGRPYTKFRWRPGSEARYKGTIICQEVAKAKNVCQVCLLDLDYNLPVQVRDQALAESGAVIENLPQSDVGKEFALQQMANEGIIESSFAKERDNPTIMRLQRTTPYYQRNKAQICSFFARGECKRGAECPYRHEMPTSGPLAEQNIKDRYYGVNDPVANKMMDRMGEREKLQPPEDGTIMTMYVGSITPSMSEDDIREPFLPFGTVASIRKLEARHCAFVTFASRPEAEAAAEGLSGSLIIQGQRCRLLWGKPQQDRAPPVQLNTAMLPSQVQLQREPAPTGSPVQGGQTVGSASDARPPLPQQQQPPNFFALPPPGMFGAAMGAGALYPSMDPQALGTRGAQFGLKRPSNSTDGGQMQRPRMGLPPMYGMPPPGMLPPPGAIPPPGMMMQQQAAYGQPMPMWPQPLPQQQQQKLPVGPPQEGQRPSAAPPVIGSASSGPPPTPPSVAAS